MIDKPSLKGVAEALGFGKPDDISDVISASIEGIGDADGLDAADDLESSAENIAALADVLLMASWNGEVKRKTLTSIANLMFNEGARLLRAKDAVLGVQKQT